MMTELLRLLDSFRQCLEQQRAVFAELLPVLDREEEVVVRFDVSAFERVVAEKDQIVRRAEALESQRLALLRRLCFLVSYDARGNELPTLSSFAVIFETYLGNVQKLLEPALWSDLSRRYALFAETAQCYREEFARTHPRIRRNKRILESLSKNMDRSLALLQSESSVPRNYDAQGRAHARMTGSGVLSSVRIKA